MNKAEEVNVGERDMLSRKWILTLLIQVASTAGLFLGYSDGAVYHTFLDGANYATISAANITAYSLANMAEYYAKAYVTRKDAEMASISVEPMP